jgi:hypothetical protein
MMTRTERRRLTKEKVLPEVAFLLEQMEEPGGQRLADVFIDNDTVLHLEIVKLI